MERSRSFVGRSVSFLRAAVIALAIAIIPQGIWSVLAISTTAHGIAGVVLMLTPPLSPRSP